MPAKNTATTVKLLRRRFVEDEVPALAYPKVPSRVVPFLNLRYRESPEFRFSPVHNVVTHLPVTQAV